MDVPPDARLFHASILYHTSTKTVVISMGLWIDYLICLDTFYNGARTNQQQNKTPMLICFFDIVVRNTS